ncbi:MAG: nucleoside deaminase [Corynebacterium sp.]|nr:nucleoside deaminase [Corynebacterium sp.]
MQQALGLLEDCQASPDVPVAALVLSPQGEVLGIGLNRREVLGDPTAHAEVEAIRQAVKVYGDGWRLEGCTLVVTLEPCAMCAGTIMNSRVSRVIFGAYEPKTGACGSVLDVLRDPILRPNPEVIGGIAAAECSAVLEDFFQRLRGLHVTKDA